jgi:RNA polymerase sigma-70 factor (ECF subfamily)
LAPEPLATADVLTWGRDREGLGGLAADLLEADALVAAARDGDRQAQAMIYRRYRSCVVRRLSHLVGPELGIGDLVQETFMRVIEGLPTYRGAAPFEHWVLRVATNVARTHYRARRRSLLRLWSGAGPERDLPCPGQRVDESYPELQVVHRALAQLSPRLREAVILHDLEGVSLGELAAQLDVPLHTAASRVRRGRERLRRCLMSLGVEGRGDGR